jgi:hypothetical protein
MERLYLFTRSLNIGGYCMASDLSEPPSSDDLRIVVFEDHEATSRRLVELETQIQRNGSAIGLALREIRDRRLYRETHPTFESYLEKRWGYSPLTAIA